MQIIKSALKFLSYMARNQNGQLYSTGQRVKKWELHFCDYFFNQIFLDGFKSF